MYCTCSVHFGHYLLPEEICTLIFKHSSQLNTGAALTPYLQVLEDVNALATVHDSTEIQFIMVFVIQ